MKLFSVSSSIPVLLFALVLSGFSGQKQVSAGGRVDVVPGDGDTMEIRIDDKPFATYNYGHSLPKPFLLPVRTESGTVLNRILGDASDADHPHHKGLWLSIDEVNGERFWAEKAPIINVSVKAEASGTEAAVLHVVNSWKNSQSEEVELTETTRITIHSNRLLSWDIRLTAAVHDVTFEDTKEGLLGFRVAPSMKEKNGGHVVSSDGQRGTKDCWGKTFAWIDYSGTVDGKTVGVALMDHPANFRPSRYHVRDYGLFSVSPFGEKSYTNGALEAKPLHLKTGESVRLQYGVYFHDGDTAASKVADVYDQFLKATQAQN